MSRARLSLLAAAAVAAVPVVLPAQALLDRSVRTGPQVTSYKVDAADQRTITEFAFPIAVAFPLFHRMSVDLATAYANVTYDSASASNSISGLTDTQLRASYAFGTDNVVLTMGLNLPTGTETVNLEKQGAAAGLIGNDFLAFPVSNMGTGFAGTGGIAVARQAGGWNVGAGASFRRTVEFEPFEPVGGSTDKIRFQPGDEYRFRAGVDRGIGVGSFAAGVTYFKFGKDDVGSTTYSSGDRILGQVGYSRPIGGTTLALAAWDLHRAEGELAGDTPAPSENIVSVGGSLGFRMGARAALEPNAEWRRWTVGGDAAGTLGLFGLRARFEAGRLAFIPSAQLATGSLDTNGTGESDGLSGWRGVFTIQWR